MPIESLRPSIPIRSLRGMRPVSHSSDRTSGLLKLHLKDKREMSPVLSRIIEQRWYLPYLIMTILVTFGVLLPCLGFNFNPATDDYHFILFNPIIRSTTLDGLLAVVTSLNKPFNELQPVTFLTYWLDYAVFGLKPVGFYATQIVLHLINVLLVFFLMKEISESDELALVTALIFGIHPLQVDTVAMLNQRENLLAALFAFLSMMMYIRWKNRRSPLHIGAAFCCFGMSLLSEASWVILPLLLNLINFFQEGSLSRGFLSTVPFFVLSALFSILTLWSQSSGQMLTPYHFGDLGSQLLLVCLVYSDSLLSFFFPLKLSTGYVYRPEDLSSWRILASGAVLSMVLTIIGVGFRAVTFRKEWRLAAFGLSWLLITYFPMSQIIPFQIVRSDHYMYNSIAGLGLFVGIVTFRCVGMNRARKNILPILGGLCVLLSPLTLAQLKHYTSPFTYISRYTDTQGWDSSAAALLARVYSYRGQYTESIEQYMLAIGNEVEPFQSSLRIQLAWVYVKVGRFAEAREQLQHAQPRGESQGQADQILGIINGLEEKLPNVDRLH